MAAGRKTAELASEPWQIGHGTPTVRIRVGLSHSFRETRTGGGRCSPTGPEPTSVNIAVTGGNLYPARCCCLLLSNFRVGDDTGVGLQRGGHPQMLCEKGTGKSVRRRAANDILACG
jgi:hypothetical protein